MGKNKNKNLVKRSVNGTLLGKSMKKYLNDEAIIVKGIIGKPDDDTLKLLQDTRDLDLTRAESETTARLLLSTFEFQNPNEWANVGKFLDHLYDCSRTVQGFGAIIDQICEDVKMEDFCKTHATDVVQVTCAWIIVRALLDTVFSELEPVGKAQETPQPKAEPEKKEPVIELNKVKVEVIDKETTEARDENTYVLNAKEEATARELGLPVGYHILDMNKFYQAEMDAATDWRNTHGVYAPAHHVYGMSRKEYVAWKKDIYDFIAKLEADNDEVVASSNIGKAEKEEKKPERRMEKATEEPKEEPKFQLMEYVDNAEKYRKMIAADPKAAKNIVDSVLADKTVKECLNMVRAEYYNVMKLALQQKFDILYGAKELDTEAAVTAAVLIASKYGISEEDAVVFMIPALSNDGEFMAKFALELLKPDNIKALRKGIIDNNIVAPQTLRDMVHDWTKKNSNSNPEGNTTANVDYTSSMNLGSAGLDSMTDAIRKFFKGVLGTVNAIGNVG